ncbi:SDR family oxidoreductase [Tenacibaculum sp. ZH5_bin.1]|uniref:SDR family oxidoreductase n=1 Tax=Tenacibaculum TaxID=104267 RepID=UPI00142F90BD|nr:SDR family oxidoreductase [Tenacibaculum mesophilum]KAF9658493.1 SDR family oxidoreductase [Tenacibaculum mesophilum]
MNKTILITGTSTGIGRATAILFSKKGWNVIASMLDHQKETELTTLENVLVTEMDITKPKTIESTIKKGIEKFGRIDALVNNAAYGQYGLFEAATPDQIENQFRVNVFGTMNVTRAILPHFRNNKQGTIINISSAGGRIGIPLISLYNSSKFALEGFSESLSYELSSQNITLKLVEPGGVATPFHEVAKDNYAFDSKLTDYNEYTSAFAKKFETMHHGIASAEEVAETTFLATTDDSDQFRYIVGNDAKGWIKDRTSMDDLTFIRHMREIFKV